MRLVFQLLAGIPAMAVFAIFCRYLVIGISADFGVGCVAGALLMLVIMYLVWRVNPESFQGDDSLRK